MEIYQWFRQKGEGSPLSGNEFQIIASDLEKTQQFYQIALKRDPVLVRNALARMEHGRHKTAVLLTGGFHTPGIERLLREVGFRNIQWHTPIVSGEGITAMGADFWNGYTADPELGYLTAEK